MALFTPFPSLLKIGKLLEQEGSRQFAVFSLSLGKSVSGAHGHFEALNRFSQAADYELKMYKQR